MVSAATTAAGLAARPLTGELSARWQAAAGRQRVFVLGALAVLAALAFAQLTLISPVIAPVTLLTWIVLGAIAWRPVVGLFVAFTAVLLFENGGPDELMLPGAYIHGGLGNFVGLGGILPSPLELLLVLTFLSWLVRGIMRRNMPWRGGTLGRPALFFTLMLVYGLARGLSTGGDLSTALWESRFLFYMVLCYVLAANTVHSIGHVRLLNTIVLVSTTLFSVEGAYRRIALIDTGRLGVVPEFSYSHEDVVFLGTLLLLVLAQMSFGAPFWQRLFGPMAFGVTGFTLLATERRAGYIAVVVAFAVMALVLLFTNRKAFVLIAMPLFVAMAIYLPIFWNSSGLVGQPARAVRSMYQPDPRDAASNLYRDLELINVRATIHANPLTGVGFGREFYFIVPLPDLSWWAFWRYEPHHNVLWVWLKTGAFGFIAFFTFLGGGIARAAHVVRTVRAREARVFALLSLCTIVSTLVFCYVDLGLVSPRVTVYLGTCLGTLAVLEQFGRRQAPSQQTARPAAVHAKVRPLGTGRLRHRLAH